MLTPASQAARRTARAAGLTVKLEVIDDKERVLGRDRLPK